MRGKFLTAHLLNRHRSLEHVDQIVLQEFLPIRIPKTFCRLLRTYGALKPDKFTYPFVIKACGLCLTFGCGGSVHSMALKVGLGSDSHVNNNLLTMYGGCGIIGLSGRVFDEMCERDVVSWSSMISAFVDCSRALDALTVFEDMMMVNENPNLVTLVSLLAACTSLVNVRVEKSIHSYIIANGIELHVGLGTVLLNMYAKSGHLEEAFHIFNSICDRNLQSWTVMISGFALWLWRRNHVFVYQNGRRRLEA